jgi:DNA helicase HerA-like ATPase
MKLQLGPDFALPPAVVTEKLAFLGRTGSGKSYAAQKLAEEIYRAGAQFVVLDPVGIWFSLRLAVDGKKPGLPIPVLGGLRGDIPLEPTAGALIANLVVERASEELF